MRFLHTADIHLGYQQYNSRERFDDFGQAFLHVVDEARKEQVNFFLLAGDFFEKRTVDPLAMRQAVEGLQQLRDAHIPVIAVEGNHERAHYRDQYSWLQFLAAIGLLVLLDAPIRDGRLLLEPYSVDQGGAYVDLPGGIRVYGLKYYGASTPKALDMLQQSLAEQAGPRPPYNILLTHAGLEGVLPRCLGAVSQAALDPLRPWFNYLALGHIHKPYSVDHWIHNPGSLETWAIDESAWSDRGYYLVDVAAHSPMDHQARLVATPRRPFERLRVSVETCPTPESVFDAVQKSLRHAKRREAADRAPVVELTLDGTLLFDRLDLDLGHVEALVKEALNPLLARVQNATVPADFQIDVHSLGSRAELEQQVLGELIARDQRFRPHAGEWAEVALEIKRQALAGQRPEDILDFLRRKRAELTGTPSSEAAAPVGEP